MKANPTKKSSQIALKNAEERYRAIFEQAPNGVLLIDTLTGRTIECNETACRQLDYTREELLGLSIKDYEASETPEEIARHMHKVIREGSDDFETLHRRKDGEIRNVHVWAKTIKQDKKTLFYVIYEDITERKRAESILELQSVALNSAANAIVITDRSGIVRWVNPAFTKLTGYAASEVEGKNLRFLKSGKHAPGFYQSLWETILSGQIWRAETINRRKDGSLYSEYQIITPVMNASGAITNFVAIKEDITERKSLEAQFQQAQKMEAVGQLAGGVAHDFNNLLTIINGYSEIMLTKLPPQDPTREYLKSISLAGNRAASLTRQLLAFSRKTVLEPKVLDLNAAVAETEKMLRRLIGEDIHLTTVLEPKLKRVKADPGQLTQVLMNLAVNARDAMPKGGRLTIETCNAVLDETYTKARADVQPGPYALLAISDTGLGIPPEIQARIFEPFFTTKEIGKGTGLGLAVVHGIIKQSGGHVAVYSEPNVGTTFKIYLPSLEAGPTESSAGAAAVDMSGTETILLVEDEEGVRQLAAMSLQACGYKVLQARGGQEALKLMESHNDPIQLLATDVVMPGMNGRELAEALGKRFQHLKVLYVSGYTDDAVVRHGILQAQVAFLQKPYTQRALLTKIRQVLDQEKRG